MRLAELDGDVVVALGDVAASIREGVLAMSSPFSALST